MPLYEYECDTCAHRFEVIQKFSDPPPSACPKCGGAVQKLVSSPAIQFKGSGFYLTDYGRGGKSDTAPGKGGKADGGGDSSASKTSESSGSGPAAPAAKSDGSAKSDSKPAAPAAPAKSD
jgi:putative FmdB family regulatory protein